MAVSSIVNSLNTKMRMSGLTSGLDIDTMVKQMMAGDTAKIEKVKANMQIDEWKTETYRGMTSELQGFYNTYFDSLSSTNLKSANSFSSYTTSFGDTTSTNYVKVTAGTSAVAGKYSITGLEVATAATLIGGDVSKPMVGGVIDTTNLGNMTSANNILSITLNGVTKNITVNENGNSNTIGELQVNLQESIDKAFGAEKIKVDLNSTADGIKFSAYRPTDSFSIGSDSSAITVLGLGTSNLSNKVDLNAKLSDLTKSIGKTDSANSIMFTINGTTSFSFDSTQTSIQDIMDKVNSNTTINATMKYDTTTNSFTIKSNSTGLTDKLEIVDTTGTLMQTLGINGTDTGTDASVTINGTKIVRPTNSFTYDGLTYEIEENFTSGTDIVTGKVTDPIEVAVNNDTTKTYNYIKTFVDKYNEVIDKINTKLNEKRDKNYTPLTDEQKAAMTADQVTQWETKAKAGLLKNDSILSSVVSKLRTALYDTVEGAGISLSSIGITTSSDVTVRGKLQIDETKLKQALTNNPEQIKKLFTNSSDKSYYDALDSSAIRSERYNESGIADRLSDILQDAIRTTTDNDGNKGSLLMKAGIVGDRSEYTNLLFKEMASFDKSITDMNAKLTDKETALYSKFTSMESALSKMNSQSSWLAQQFGTSSS